MPNDSDSSPAPHSRLAPPRRRTSRPIEPLAVSIEQAAGMIGVSYNTLWRAVSANQFPGVRVRDRIIIPIKAIHALLNAAATSGELVDAAEWTAAWTQSIASTTTTA
jgi:hypothetical protein